MRDVTPLRQEALAQSLSEFLRQHPAPVLIARQILAGELRRREPTTRPGRPVTDGGRPDTDAGRPDIDIASPVETTRRTRIPLAEVAGGSVYAGTMAHVKPSPEPNRFVDPEMMQDRELATQRYAELRKARHTPPHRPITLGRSHESDVVLNDFTVSSEHARFMRSREDGGYLLVDVNSTNGTRVGGRRLVRGRPYPIQSGERLVLGRLVLRFLTPQDFYLFLTAPHGLAAKRRA